MQRQKGLKKNMGNFFKIMGAMLKETRKKRSQIYI